ncbi:MAG: hypothetical protein JEZ07_09825 [Phycisphaerae bacterium]|nr:hypothetical protein [Phycisphaerae bacterium]
MAHDHKNESCSCGDDHGRDPLLDVELDSGQEALERALKQSFVLLKFVMILLIGLFIWSGMFEVQTSERAVKLRFGEIVGTRDKAVLGPGWHWSWPYPVEEIIKFPMAGNKKPIKVDSFWYYEDEATKSDLEQNQRIPPELQIVREGYSITAAGEVDPDIAILEDNASSGRDCSLVHTKWEINYMIRKDASRPNESYLKLFEKAWDGTDAGWGNVKALLRTALEDAVIRVSARHDIDWMLEGNQAILESEVASAFQSRVRDLDIGIEAELVLPKILRPRQVKRAYDEATRAHNEADKLKTQAYTMESQILTAARSQKEIVIANAQTYRKLIVEATKSEAQYMTRFLKQIEDTTSESVDKAKEPDRWKQEYAKLLDINLDILYQQMLRDVAGRADEVFLNGKASQIRVQLNRDPNIKKKKQ